MIKQYTFSLANLVSLCRTQDTIVVAGSPRSGTTWLSEIIRELSGYKLLDEPLSKTSSILVQHIKDLDWRPYVSENEQAEEIRKALNNALKGRAGRSHMWRFQSETPMLRLLEHISQRKLVAKIIRANRMLPWLTSQFALRAVVSIFRHPCAVVASQVQYQPGWRNAGRSSESVLETAFCGKVPGRIVKQFGDTLSQVESTHTFLTAVWCIDTYMALERTIHAPRVITTYEDLVRHPDEETRRIFDFLDTEVPYGVEKRLRRPSDSAAEDLKISDTEAQLSKWRDALNEAQIREIMQVVEGFGLNDIYSESLYPNTEALRARVEKAQNESAATNAQKQQIKL
jgi:hypothetical protein